MFPKLSKCDRYCLLFLLPARASSDPQMGEITQQYCWRSSKRSTKRLFTVSRQKGSRLPLQAISTFFAFRCLFGFAAFTGFVSGCRLIESFSSNTEPYLAFNLSKCFLISSLFSLIQHCFLLVTRLRQCHLCSGQSAIWHSSLQYVRLRHRSQLGVSPLDDHYQNIAFFAQCGFWHISLSPCMKMDVSSVS